MRLALRVVGVALALAVLGLSYAYWTATRDSVVRTVSLAMPDWPTGDAPIRVAFLADIHVAGPDMPPSRLAGIVLRVNRLKPDFVLIGGDLVSDKRTATKYYEADAAISPLSNLKARLGVVAVLGNHDHWRGAAQIRSALAEAGVRVLANEAKVAGPLMVGGVDDAFTGQADIMGTVVAMRSKLGARVILSHSPDIAPALPRDVTLLLAGHTHCGQIRLPVLGAISYMSKYGDRFACGISRSGSTRVITSAGLGTSILPLRLGTSPEIWIVTMGPELRSPVNSPSNRSAASAR